MHRFTVDYSKDRPRRGTLLNRGYFLNGLPRLVALCRILGHKPIVDGYDSQYGGRKQTRWVVCDRCGIRPDPQGTLDADQWNLGQRYTGPFNPTQPMSPTVRKQLIDRGHDAGIRQPGAWPAKPTSDIGAQLILGRTWGGFAVDFKVGSPSSEQCLAAHISLNPLGALYLHTESHGRWIQRRLNNTERESRVTGLRLADGRLDWNIWARRDARSITDPWWMHGSVSVDPRHYLWGPLRGNRTQRSDKTTATVYMPDGTQHAVTLTLEQWERGRTRGRKTTTWEADWYCTDGIPVRFDRAINGASVELTEQTATYGQWEQAACAAIAAQCAEDRARYGYEPSTM